MSVLLDATSDTLRTTFPALTVTTGSIHVIAWVKFISDLNQANDLFHIGDQVNPVAANRLGLTTDTDGLDVLGFPGGSGPFTASLSTWYGFVWGREAATNHCGFRTFPDSSSTTELNDNWGNNTTNWSGLIDNLLIGNRGTGSGSANIEIANLKIITGVYLTPTQCRAELDNFAIQVGGYTEGYVWELENINADSHGINERSGSGYNLTNSGVTNGSSRPNQLEAASGGGGNVFVKSPKLYSFGTMRRSL